MGLPSHGQLGDAASGVFRSGDVLDGRYRIEHVIAEGGVAIVVAAEQLGLDRHVAIKLLRPEMLADRLFVEHFKTEGSLAAKIKSEHVVRIHDVGEEPSIGPYMVMELLEGHDLEQRLAQGPIAMEEAVDYVLQACDALVEAHHLRIVHRDIKPANLFLAERPPRAPIVKIIDFGISKVVPRTADGPATDTVAGTPAYMSPEQIVHGGIVDARADIWALGTVLFELMTTQLPFPLDAPERMLEAICKTSPIPLRALRPDLPEALEAIILKCLARDVAHRYATVTELAAALAPFRGMRDAMKSSGEIDVAHAYTDPRRQALTIAMEPPKPKRAVLFAALGLVILAAIGAGLIIVSRRPSAATVAPPSAVASATTLPPPPAAESSDPPPAVTAAALVASNAAPSASTSTSAKTRVAAPAKTKPASAPHKRGDAPSNDRSMFGERK
jgi:eukaryotic-like serine/threonine-protein kinase